MSSQNDGWLSTVSKLFSSGSRTSPSFPQQSRLEVQEESSVDNVYRDSNITNGSIHNTGPPRSLRYLSPSALDGGFLKPGVSKPRPSEDIFGITSSTRKRVLTSDERPATAMDGIFSRDNPKRFRREHFGHSMLETLHTNTDDLESPWLDRSMGGSLSCVDFAHSPCSSNRSLISRIGGNRSNSSSLSSKTKAILNHLERINTPAREARKLPVMRGSTVPSERWAPMHIGAAPPLVRSSATVPSRIQLLSSSMAAQRKPYWRDITRKTQEKEKSAARKETNVNADKTSVHPLFDIDDESVRGHTDSTGKMQEASAISSSSANVIDKSKNERLVQNVFSARQLFEDESNGVDSSVDQPLFAPPTKAVPSTEIKNDFVFSFAPPVERLPGREQFLPSTSDAKSGSVSDGEESGTDVSEDEEDSSPSDVEEDTTNKNLKSSRPPTAADSETSAVISSSITPASSNDASPQTKVESSWECPDCFITNKNVSVCVACGHNKDGGNASKALVSNISSFAKSAPSTTFSFGLSSGKLANGSSKPSVAAAVPTCTSESPSKGSDAAGAATANVGPAPAVLSVPVAPQADSSTTVKAIEKEKTGDLEKERKPWDCPDCMVQNKATDDKCVCCGHVMYKSSQETPSAANVFGDRAFKPPSSTGFTFGLSGAAANGATSIPTVKFGFGTSSIKEAPAAKEQSSAIVSAPSVQNSNGTVIASVFQPKSDVQPPLLKTASSPSFVPTTESVDKPQTTAFTLGAGSSLFGAGAKPPLFGSSSTSLFNSSSSTGSLLTTPATTAAAISANVNASSQAAPTNAPAPFTFGASAPATSIKPFGLFDTKKDDTSASAPKAPVFGSGLTFGTPSTAPSTTMTGSITSGTAGNAGSTSSTTLFGSSMSSKPLFSSFGSTAEAPKPMFGAAVPAAEAPKVPVFGASQSVAAEKPKPLFGSTPPISKSIFGAPAASTTSSTNGGLSFNFGSNNAFGGFGAGVSSNPAPVPPLSATSSTNSLFSAVQQDTSKPFQFGATIPEPTFQFGQAPLAGPTPFQFGSTQPAAPAFGATGITAPAVPSSNFAFTSSSTTNRKLVAARRRLPQRK
ncbi:unnamed protein product [Cylicocyclus nassatus]|uniref:RanBP2-type domain-containing protein n=1 Tax=Cylicocyclus nassatus TaxID=53992 RepID=A0AA36GLN3_CYLNA|nr:unnamed protein product [Cylicocyclus nassatus]